MQPKSSSTTSLTALDAFAREHGLDEEYRQKLATLMGLQMAPSKEREVIDLDEWQKAQDARTIDLDAPPVIDLDAPAPREVIDLDEWQRSQNARAIDLDAPPVIDLDEPQPQGREFIDYNAMGRPKMDMYAQAPSQAAQPQGFSEVTSDAPTMTKAMTPYELYRSDPKAYFEHQKSMEAANKPAPAPASGETWKDKLNYAFGMPRPMKPEDLPMEAVPDASLAESAALSASTPKANDHPGLEFYRPGGGGGISSGMRMNLEGLQNEMAQANDNVRKSYMGVGDAQAATLDPAVTANRNISALDMERAKRLQEQAERQYRYNKTFEQKAKEIDRFTKEQQDKLMGMDPLDPKRAWTQADFGGKLAILGSYIGAAFAMNYGNDPRAAERATEAIFGKDLEKQKMEYEKQRGNVDIGKNRYAALMSQYNDDQAATAAYYQPIYKALDAKIDAEIAKSKGGEAAANQQVIKAQIGQKLATIDATTTQGKLGAAQAMAMRAMSGPGGVQQNAPIPITKEVETEQAALEKKLVKSPAGVFKFNGNEELAKKYNEELMGSSRMISGIDAALAAARNTNALGGAAGFYKSQAWKSLDSNIAQLVAEYGKSKGLGALDKGTVDLFKQIVGDPSRDVADVAKLLADFRARSISNISSSLKGIVLQPVYTLPAYNPRTGARTTIFQEGPVQNQQMGGLNLQGATPVQGPR